MQPLLKLTGIDRSYGAIQALEFRGEFRNSASGEVMGLVGENGAGKSTMVKIIGGFDNGLSLATYEMNGQPRCGSRRRPRPRRAGIAIAQQELSRLSRR